MTLQSGSGPHHTFSMKVADIPLLKTLPQMSHEIPFALCIRHTHHKLTENQGEETPPKTKGLVQDRRKANELDGVLVVCFKQLP